ncbi:MAG: ROK family transcriptional regulator [Pseudorhodobacter sp.]|nr:ROK family transcriptional regulator [Pseudorhodobacter sp.]
MRQEQDSASDRPTAEASGLRGSNQSGMRAHNERLVLSLVRQQGALAKSDIARSTGLSAQTVSVIMRSLERDGLLRRGEPIRGRVGQPLVPMSLDAQGAFFVGLKIGRRSVDLTLIDFLGHSRATRTRLYRYPTPDAVVTFVTEALPALIAELPGPLRSRISGLGIAMPFQLWDWVEFIGAPQSEMDAWRHRDVQTEIAAIAGMPVYMQNDATAACGAELVFGTGERPQDFLYFYFGYFIGGGLVLNGQLFTGRSGNAAGVGSMPVPVSGPGPDGRMRSLISIASISTLADAMEAAGEPSGQLWEDPDHWQVSAPILQAWIAATAEGLASASLSAAALVEIEAVLIDGWMPVSIRAEITRQTDAALHRLDLAGIIAPVIREGTVGAQARSLGAAAIPLSQRYLLDQNSMLKDI